MKAIILAAGKGIRMGKYTENLPKGMLCFGGKTLLEWQIAVLRYCGIDQIIIVTGYKKDAIQYENITYYDNDAYADTNMVETLMCAKNEFDDDSLVIYSDILYTPALISKIVEEEGDVVVAVDAAWRNYWMMRYNTTESDLETLEIQNNQIIHLGQEVKSSKEIDYRYIGVIKYSERIWTTLLNMYGHKQLLNEAWQASGNTFKQGFMTDLLNELILTGSKITPSITQKQWLEFDTPSDYEITNQMYDKGALSKYFNIEDLEAVFSKSAE